jgi:methyl-accepting chemotaxis protein
MKKQLYSLPISFRVAAVAFIGITILGIFLDFFVFRSIDNAMRDNAFKRQQSNIAVSWEILRQKGADFKVINGQLYAGTYQINENYEVVDRIQDLVGGVATIFMGDTRVTTNIKKPDGTRAIGTKLAQGPVYDSIFLNHRAFRGEADIFGEPYFTAYDPILNSSGDVIGILFTGIKQADFLNLTTIVVHHIVIFMTLSAIVLGLIIAFLIRGLLSPIHSIENAMLRLADNDHAIAIPAINHQDEIGRMARAVLIFKDHMIREKQLSEQQHAEDVARQQRSQHVNMLIHEFNKSIAIVVNNLTIAGDELEKEAQELSLTADETSHQIISVGEASIDVSNNIKSVAEAAKELTVSVFEIDKKIKESEKIAHTAVQEAHNTNMTVTNLSNAAQKIGDIVQIIHKIASQTDLLALNATIEAARSGATGKGFAIVASEVKILANQTSKATKDIQIQIAQMQQISLTAVNSIKSITDIIIRMSDITTAIATLIDDQSTATNEILKNVQEVSNRTSCISKHIEKVTDSAKTTGAMAIQTFNYAKNLNHNSIILHNDVEKFIANVRSP